MIFGIDTSSVAVSQRIDWTRVKAETSIGFAILRAAYGNFEDPLFVREWNELRDIGITRGAYFFLRFPTPKLTVPSHLEQAKAAIGVLSKRLSTDDFPPILDIEFPGSRKVSGLSADECLEQIVEVWRRLADAFGTAPLIYTSARVWREDLNDLAQDEFADSPLWLARYWVSEGLPPMRDASKLVGARYAPPVPRPWGDADNWWLHQYQGDAKGFPGVPGNVDMNRFNTMAKGAKGARVSWVQRRLVVPVTGEFDLTLEANVRAFQRRNELMPDGIVGPKTFARLCW